MTFSDLPTYFDYVKETPTILLDGFLEKCEENKQLSKHGIILEESDIAIVAIGLTLEISVGENFDIIISHADISKYNFCNITLIHASLRTSKKPEMIMYSGHPYFCVFRLENKISKQIVSSTKLYNILTKRNFFLG